MSATIQPTLLDSYNAHQGTFCNDLEDNLVIANTFFAGLEAIAKIGQQAGNLVGNPRPAFEKAGESLDNAGLALSLLRALQTLEKVVTGKIFWEYEIDTNGTITSKLRDWKEIACNVCETAIRALYPIVWLDRINAIRLGDHALGIIKNIVMAISAFLVGFNIYKGINDYYDIKEEIAADRADQTDLNDTFVKSILKVVDALSYPLDALLVSGHPVALICAAALSFVNSMAGIFATWYFTSQKAPKVAPAA